MFKGLLLFSFFVYVAIGAASYGLIAGSQADWSQLVTYVWTLFWPFVILLGFFYYSPFIFLAILAAAIIAWQLH
jgi:hypothetical protein